MFRKIIAGTAVAGALTLGLAGAAGASTGSTGSTGPAITSSTTVCASRQIQARVQEVGGKLDAELPKAQDRETKAKAAGNTKLADRIAARITQVQDRENKVNARLAKLSSACGSGSTAG